MNTALPPDNIILQDTIDIGDRTIENLCNQLIEERKTNTKLCQGILEIYLRLHGDALKSVGAELRQLLQDTRRADSQEEKMT